MESTLSVEGRIVCLSGHRTLTLFLDSDDGELDLPCPRFSVLCQAIGGATVGSHKVSLALGESSNGLASSRRGLTRSRWLPARPQQVSLAPIDVESRPQKDSQALGESSKNQSRDHQYQPDINVSLIALWGSKVALNTHCHIRASFRSIRSRRSSGWNIYRVSFWSLLDIRPS